MKERYVYQDSKSSFGDLLTKDGAYAIHNRNIQTLAIELYKVWQGIAPKIMEKVFPLNSSAKYPGQNDFLSRNTKHVNYGTDSLAHLGPKIWSMVPLQWKTLSLSIFSKKIRKWKPDECPCRLCKTYVQNVGYVGKISY